MGPGVRPEGWLRRCCVQGQCAGFCSQHPIFAPGSLEVAGGFCGLFVSFVENLL